MIIEACISLHAGPRLTGAYFRVLVHGAGKSTHSQVERFRPLPVTIRYKKNTTHCKQESSEI